MIFTGKQIYTVIASRYAPVVSRFSRDDDIDYTTRRRRRSNDGGIHFARTSGVSPQFLGWDRRALSPGTGDSLRVAGNDLRGFRVEIQQSALVSHVY